MSLFRPTIVLTALLALGAASVDAQTRRPASVWTIPLPDRDGRWESRNGDSDSDSDWDSDSDSEINRRSRRGSILDRIDPRRRTSERQRTDSQRLEREIKQAHDEWHRRNDRMRRDRDWERRHTAMHAELERVRRQQSQARRPGSVIR
ncbi:MAG: hypothetical protein KFH98_02565 [Gemmatimonadetes bacterium]|nr:hypothetical protein [Gemmatimonadota bacterium]